MFYIYIAISYKLLFCKYRYYKVSDKKGQFLLEMMLQPLKIVNFHG